MRCRCARRSLLRTRPGRGQLEGVEDVEDAGVRTVYKVARDGLEEADDGSREVGMVWSGKMSDEGERASGCGCPGMREWTCLRG